MSNFTDLSIYVNVTDCLGIDVDYIDLSPNRTFFYQLWSTFNDSDIFECFKTVLRQDFLLNGPKMNTSFDFDSLGGLVDKPSLDVDSNHDWTRMVWFGLFSLMILSAILGNSLVIVIIATNREMRTTVTNLYLLNLAIADLITATLNAPFNFIYMLDRNWKFGESYCTASNFIAYSTVASSVFTITATSIDR